MVAGTVWVLMYGNVSIMVHCLASETCLFTREQNSVGWINNARWTHTVQMRRHMCKTWRLTKSGMHLAETECRVGALDRITEYADVRERWPATHATSLSTRSAARSGNNSMQSFGISRGIFLVCRESVHFQAAHFRSRVTELGRLSEAAVVRFRRQYVSTVFSRCSLQSAFRQSWALTYRVSKARSTQAWNGLALVSTDNSGDKRREKNHQTERLFITYPGQHSALIKRSSPRRYRGTD